MVSPQFRPIAGGYERAAERLSEGLVARGHSVEVVTERRSTDWPRRELSNGVIIYRIPVIYLRGLHSVTSTLSLLFFLLTRARHFDIIHVHQYGWSAGASAFVGLVFGKPTLLKLTNTGRQGLDATLPRGVLGAALRWLHRNISCCIVTSKRAEEEAKAFGFSDKRVALIPNALETEVFKPVTQSEKQKIRAELNIHSRFAVLSAARMSPEKNHKMLIDAWERFASKTKNVELILLGSGALLEDVRRWAKATDVRNTIRVVGYTETPLHWYQAVDAYALSSDIEGLSNSLMEALSSGLAVVSTRVSGSEDIFKAADVGEIVDVGDGEALAKALSILENDHERHVACGLAARNYAVAHYALERITRITEDCYLEQLTIQDSDRGGAFSS